MIFKPGDLAKIIACADYPHGAVVLVLEGPIEDMLDEWNTETCYRVLVNNEVKEFFSWILKKYR